MRKILCILMGVIMACLLAACRGQQNEQKSSPEDGSEENTVLQEESGGDEDVSSIPEQQPEGTEIYASQYPYDSVFPQHEPYGEGIGAMPGRVVWNYDTDSVLWDGDGYWWRPENFEESVIQGMVDDSIASLGGKETAGEGWNALFQAHNAARGKGSVSYAAGEKIAIKANINGSGVFDDETSGETQMSYTNPVLLKALLVSLVEEAGIPPEDITVYDVSRLFPDYMAEMCTEGILEEVRFVDRRNGTADENVPINWSYEFSGAVNYLPTCVTEAEYLINLANLKGHSYGITLCGKNHFGSFINGNAMRPPEGANLHQFLTRNEMGAYSPLTDLMANEQLGGKTVLYMLDALICATSEGASITEETARWQQAPFDGNYTSSVFVSQDPVAIDSVGADFLINEPAVTEHNGALRDNPNVENYLHEAGMVHNAPSENVYYNGNGEMVENLGVHEHWNNSVEKMYSRNLGKEEGIELVRIYAKLKNGKHPWYSDRKQTTIWNYDKPKRNKNHPTSKPLDLLGYPISNSSQENAVVIDTFGGSGSTMMACEQTNRICCMMELDEKYASVILRRYVEDTGDSENVYVERGGEKIPYSALVKEVETDN